MGLLQRIRRYRIATSCPKEDDNAQVYSNQGDFLARFRRCAPSSSMRRQVHTNDKGCAAQRRRRRLLPQDGFSSSSSTNSNATITKNSNLLPLTPRRVGNEIAIIVCGKSGWDSQKHIQELIGVTRVVPGYTGGDCHDAGNARGSEGYGKKYNTLDDEETTTTTTSNRDISKASKYSSPRHSSHGRNRLVDKQKQQQRQYHVQRTSPTYENMQGHYQGLFIEYNPKMITYRQIISEVCCYETNSATTNDKAAVNHCSGPEDDQRHSTTIATPTRGSSSSTITYSNEILTTVSSEGGQFSQQDETATRTTILYPNSPSQQRESIRYLHRVQKLLQQRRSQLEYEAAADSPTTLDDRVTTDPQGQQQKQQSIPPTFRGDDSDVHDDDSSSDSDSSIAVHEFCHEKEIPCSPDCSVDDTNMPNESAASNEDSRRRGQVQPSKSALQSSSSFYSASSSSMAIEIREAVVAFYKAEERFCLTGRLSTTASSFRP